MKVGAIFFASGLDALPFAAQSTSSSYSATIPIHMLRRRDSVSTNASAIAKRLGLRIEGRGERSVRALCSIDQPLLDGIAFTRECSLKRLEGKLASLAALLVPLDFEEGTSAANTLALIYSDNPQHALVSLVDLFYEHMLPNWGISAQASIDPSAQIGRNVQIGPFSVVGAGVSVGDGAIIHPHVTIYPGAEIGANCEIHAGAVVREFCKIGAGVIIHNGAVIGADGFGYYADYPRVLHKVPQLGTVEIGNEVEIGANSCIDRAAIGVTQIGEDTKLDNLVQVGHNSQVGAHSVLCGQVGIAGSAHIGNWVTLGGNSGVRDHVTIADGVRVAAMSGVTESLSSPGDYAGYPIKPAKEWMRVNSILAKLPDVWRTLRAQLIPSDRSVPDPTSKTTKSE